MNTTKQRILELVRDKLVSPKNIADELNISNANARKILSNLCKENRIRKAGYGLYGSVNIARFSVNIEELNKINEAKEALNLFKKEVQERLKNLQEYFSQGDWSWSTIRIHSTPDILRLIESANRFLRYF